MAAALDNTAILGTLIEFGADVNIRITGGVTALHYASMENNPDAIRHVTLMYLFIYLCSYLFM